ncbi:DUF4397 domain-containing protein [Nocardioides aurantiacus]|uniref:Uncharacterized protein DUF4397 n=1 Tax=Nocardioides aurantiacus TaxID=86796 RepID=A0A3N2CS73_9ACTN|nr:DUF4397 domain-containing protein [Nocardioides aurantiacus]ROR90391.1 uncharacterized protein DUF4397 [Nocardioides aurantiacus]
MTKRNVSTALLAAAVVAIGATTGLGGGASAAGGGQVTVVQAVPGAEVGVQVDGRLVQPQAGVGEVIGPLTLAAGTHRLSFTGVPGGRTLAARVEVAAGSGHDVVLHRPAAVDGALVVSTYATPDAPIGPDKARLLLAHTATVSPADVAFDGEVVFSNIANGEYADADVPAGQHRVELLPTGRRGDPILGPLSVDLAPRTATMVYAVGNPRTRSMDVVTHTLQLSSDGSVAPRSIDTGSVGLVPRGSREPIAALSPWGPRATGRP